MNIYFCEPKFEDWLKVIQNLNMPILQNKDIINTIQNNNNAIVIPLTFTQVKLITTSLNLNDYPKVLCPKNYKTVKILNNKIKFYKFMVKNNFQNLIPITYKINDKLIQKISYPCIFKLATTYGAKYSTICKNKQTLKQCENTKYSHFVQELIIGKIERSVHLLIINGVIKWGVCYEIENNKKNHIQVGRMEKYKKIKNFDFNIFQDIFIKLDYNGFACIDFKVINDKIKIFEINPRLGGTLVNDKDFTKLIKYISDNC